MTNHLLTIVYVKYAFGCLGVFQQDLSFHKIFQREYK